MLAMQRSTTCLGLLLAMFVVVPLISAADLLPDNNPDNVRPIPKPGIDVPEGDRQELEAGLKKLGAMLDELRPEGEPYRDGIIDSPQAQLKVIKNWKAWDAYGDVAIFHRAVKIALEDRELYEPKEIESARQLLKIGMARAEQLSQGRQPWLMQHGPVVRGYISTIDFTPQPYGLIIPESYHFPETTPHRMDLWFHGRGETLSEVNFISQRLSNAGPISPSNTIVLHPYGRYCNASKFAGEMDAFEAYHHATRSYVVAGDKLAARGFSMGGAACWHFAVHYPTFWFAANPGAGFAETPAYLQFNKHETLNPTWWEQKLWRWYDCPGYAANLRHLPVVAYSGENDAQKQAADIMTAAYETEGLKLLHLIGPKTGHSIHPETAREIEAKLTDWSTVPEQHGASSDKLEFVTYSLIYPDGLWIRLKGLKEHWEEARVTAERKKLGEFHVRTKNVTSMQLMFPGQWRDDGRIHRVVIDGFTFNALNDEIVTFTFRWDQQTGQWNYTTEESSFPLSGRKHPGSCGPIDHAFMSSFIFVKPSGTCAHPAVQQWSDAEMNRAITQWRRMFRGEARVKLDTEITEDDIQTANLILWGDRRANSLIEKTIGSLPIQWNDAEIAVGQQPFDAPNHALIAIYPNPLNPSRYIVLNSGFTFREYDYLTNARQTPKLPDWAVVDLSTPPNSRWPGKIVAADFFDEEWQLKPLRK